MCTKETAFLYSVNRTNQQEYVMLLGSVTISENYVCKKKKQQKKNPQTNKAEKPTQRELHVTLHNSGQYS